MPPGASSCPPHHVIWGPQVLSCPGQAGSRWPHAGARCWMLPRPRPSSTTGESRGMEAAVLSPLPWGAYASSLCPQGVRAAGGTSCLGSGGGVWSRPAPGPRGLGPELPPCPRPRSRSCPTAPGPLLGPARTAAGQEGAVPVVLQACVYSSACPPCWRRGPRCICCLETLCAARPQASGTVEQAARAAGPGGLGAAHTCVASACSIAAEGLRDGAAASTAVLWPRLSPSFPPSPFHASCSGLGWEPRCASSGPCSVLALCAALAKLPLGLLWQRRGRSPKPPPSLAGLVGA